MSRLNGENPRLRLDPNEVKTFAQHLEAELQKRSVCAVIVDLHGMERVDPAILQTLRSAGEAAQGAGKDLYVDGAGPVVYKTLQLAKLGPLFKRLHHATTPV